MLEEEITSFEKNRIKKFTEEVHKVLNLDHVKHNKTDPSKK